MVASRGAPKVALLKEAMVKTFPLRILDHFGHYIDPGRRAHGYLNLRRVCRYRSISLVLCLLCILCITHYWLEAPAAKPNDRWKSGVASGFVP